MDYRTLITSEHQGQPKFMTWLTAATSMIEDAQRFLVSLYLQYDLDRAVGAQLDKLGELLGVPRKLPFQPVNSFYRLRINGKTALTGSGTKSPTNPYTLSGASQITVSDGKNQSQSYAFDPLYDFDDTVYDTLEIISGGLGKKTEIRELDGTEPWEYDTESLSSYGGDSLDITDSQDGGEFTKLDVEGATVQKGTNDPSPDNVRSLSGVQHVLTAAGKNLLHPQPGTVTANGVTCTVNEDGTITLDGTAAATATFELCPTLRIGFAINSTPIAVLTNGKKYTLSLTVIGGTATGSSNPITRIVNDTAGNTYPSGRIIDASENKTITAGTSMQSGFSSSLYVGSFGFYVPTVGITYSNYKLRMQFEQSDGATEWEPFKALQIIQLPQALYALPNGTRDEYDAVSGQGTRRVGRLALDGTEPFLRFRSDGNNATTVSFDTQGSRGIVNGAHNSSNLSCTHFKAGGSSTDGAENVGTGSIGEIYFEILRSRLAGWDDAWTNAQKLDAFKAWLVAQYSAGTAVTVVYPLASPILITGTPQTISTYAHTIVTTDNGGSISATYVNNFDLLYCRAPQALNGIRYCTHFDIQTVDAGWHDDKQAIGLSDSILYLKISKNLAQTISGLKTWLSSANVKFLNKLSPPASSEVTGQAIAAYSPQTVVTRDIDSRVIGTYSFSPILDDKHYRLLLYVTIAKAHFKGTIPSFKSILGMALNDTSLRVLVTDNQNMTMSVVIYGEVEPIVENMLKSGMLLPKPDGVSMAISITSNKLFSWGTESDIQGGWDEGYWVI